MCRRPKRKPPTTQPWRNLQQSPLDSNQPASEESGTVQWLEASEDILRFKAKSAKPIKNIWNEMKAFFLQKANAGYERARVKFQKADKTKETVEFDTATGNIVDERYVKRRLIKGISPVMDDSADAIVDHFAALMEEQLLEHRAAAGGAVESLVQEPDAVV